MAADLPMLFATALVVAALATLAAGIVEFRLDADDVPETELLAALVRVDALVAAELGISEEDRRCGVFDFSGPRFAMVRGDDPVDGSSPGAEAVTIRRLLMTLLETEGQGSEQEKSVADDHRFSTGGIVTGLKGRSAGVSCEVLEAATWRAEKARVERSSRTYLLATLVRHRLAEEYARRLARAVDEELCGNEPEKRWVHQFALREGSGDWRTGLELPVAFSDAVPGISLRAASETAIHESPVLAVDRWFNEALLSWNVEVPDGAGFLVDIRVGRRADGSWSPWLRIGSWGAGLPGSKAVTRFDGGRVDIDIFRSDVRYDRIQYRVTASGDGGPILVRRVSCCLSDGTGLPWFRPDPPRPTRLETMAAATLRLPVPFLSQQDQPAAIRRRICSPVSVAMVLNYHDREVTTAQAARRLFDAEHDIYGNWARAVQGAFCYGVRGYLARFSDWIEVERAIAAGRPLVITIAARKGELTGAPYDSTNGHLLVLVGFAGDEGVEVNDPAAAKAADGQVVYLRRQLEEVWLGRGGTAYVLSP